jgi:hypothetical protein
MGNIYFKANDAYLALAYDVMKKFHYDLNKAKVQLGLIITMSNKEDTPALKDGVQGIIKVVPVKDRITKSFDLELIVDGEFWKAKQELRESLIDYLLNKVEVKRVKKKAKGDNKEEPDYMHDEVGRPVIKMRKCDICAVSGFMESIGRHGDKSIEMMQLTEIMNRISAAKDINTKLSEISS